MNNKKQIDKQLKLDEYYNDFINNIIIPKCYIIDNTMISPKVINILIIF